MSSPPRRQYNGPSPSPPPIPNTTKSKSPHLEQAVVDRLQSFRKKSQPEIASLVSNINEATLLPFRDDVSSSNSGSDLIGQNNGGVADGDYNTSLPSGGESLTLDEASKFFPALMDQRPVGSPLVGAVRGTGNSNYGNVRHILINALAMRALCTTRSIAVLCMYCILLHCVVVYYFLPDI